jgi:hypothetical protein
MDTKKMKNIIDQYRKNFDPSAFFYLNNHVYNEHVEIGWVANELLSGDVKEEDLESKFDPNKIEEVYYYTNGCPDDEHWVIIGKLNNDTYFCFSASCGVSGFDACGYVNVLLSRDLASLYKYGLDDYLRFQLDNNCE